MAIATTTALLIGAGVAAAGAAKSAIDAGKANKRAKQTGRKLELAEQQRQEIVNPYENVQDLSSMITNPFANLQVATGAAEMKARETDITLAQTLDALRATGAGAGGATALAQAASRAKQEVAISIEQQEAANAQARAQGEQQAQQARMAEAQRIQSVQAAGQEFMFKAQEDRDMQRLNRLAGLQANYQQQRSQAQASMVSALGSAATIAAGAGS